VAAADNASIAAVTDTVANGEAVQLIGLGTLGTGARAARVDRNPTTGAGMQIVAAKAVRFTARKAFKDAEKAG
jgi:DNA-binding protein HU-beta